MSEVHRAYLNLGSNIQPEINLVKALQLLSEHAEIQRVSSAWESKPVGAEGPNYLNACALFHSHFIQAELKEIVIRPIETKLGRVRSEDKYTPRTIDIDIVLFDEQSVNNKLWELGFVVVPLAEIYPQYQNPLTLENMVETATRLRRKVWVEARPEVLRQFSRNSFRA